MATIAAAAEVPQHLQALGRANKVRLARADLKRRVLQEDITVGEVIMTCPWEAATMTIRELLLGQRNWGTKRCSRFLRAVGMTETKTVGSLTERQRCLLAEIL